jgi:hypothetical protein
MLCDLLMMASFIACCIEVQSSNSCHNGTHSAKQLQAMKMTWEIYMQPLLVFILIVTSVLLSNSANFTVCICWSHCGVFFLILGLSSDVPVYIGVIVFAVVVVFAVLVFAVIVFSCWTSGLSFNAMGSSCVTSVAPVAKNAFML